MRSRRCRAEIQSAGSAIGRFLAAGAALSLALVSVLALTAVPAGAHTPHDVIEDVKVSPNFAVDHTVYTISRSLLLRSTDAGRSWTKLSRGVDPKGPLVALGVSQQDPDTVYTAGYGGSPVYVSHDGGSSWANVSANLEGKSISSLAVSPWSDQLVFAAGPKGSPFWVTTTGGRSWRHLSEFEQATAVGFAPDVDGLVLVGQESGTLERSDDRGTTWSKVPFDVAQSGGIRSIAVSPHFSSDHTYFVATGSAGLYRTTDGGSSFSRVDEGLSDPKTMSLAISPSFEKDGTLWVSTYSEGVFVSTDRGSSWNLRKDGLTTNEQADLLHDSQFYNLEVAASRGGERATLFLGGFDGLFRTEDGGQAWHEMQTQPAAIVMGITPSPQYGEDRTLFLTTYINGMLRSVDGGRHWRAINSGAVSIFDWTREPTYVNRMFSITLSPDFAHDHLVFSVTRGVIFRSADAGTHWKAMIPTGALVKGEFPPDYFFLGMSPSFKQDGTILVGTDGGKVFVSKNRGKSFKRLQDLGHEVTSLVMSPDFATDATAYVGTPEGVFRTTDGGTSWARTAWPQEAGAETSLAISPQFATDHTLFAGSLNGLFSTTDGGATWQRVSAPAALATELTEAVAISPAFGQDGTLLASVEGHGLFRSTDRGATWQSTGGDLLRKDVVLANFYHATSEPLVFSPNFAHDHTVFGFDETTLVHSTDGGKTWSTLRHPTTRHSTSRASAPGGIEDTPRFGSTSSAHGEITDPPATGATGITGRKVAFAALCAVAALAALWLIERAPSRWRWVLRIALVLAAFALVLWLLERR